MKKGNILKKNLKIQSKIHQNMVFPRFREKNIKKIFEKRRPNLCILLFYIDVCTYFSFIMKLKS